MTSRVIMIIVVVIGILIGLGLGSIIIKPEAQTKTLFTTHILTSTLTQHIPTTIIKTITEKEKSLIIHATAYPFLNKKASRWLWFNMDLRVTDAEGQPIEAALIKLENVGETITNSRGEASFKDIAPGIYKMLVSKSGYKDREIRVKISFPQTEPDQQYLQLLLKDRDSRITLVAAYYGWYGLAAYKWRHWGNPENPATKYFPLISEFLGNPISQRYNLYGFSEKHEFNTKLVATQMLLAKLSGISAFAVSWWGPGSFEDRFMPTIIEAARNTGFKVTAIFEPFYKDLHNKEEIIKGAINYLKERYIEDEVWLRDQDGLPVVFTFDIGQPDEWELWNRVLHESGIAWVAHTTDRSVIEHGFKYFYEYSPVGIVRAGKDIKGTYLIVSDGKDYEDRFIPTISPRYDDTRIRTNGFVYDERLLNETIDAVTAVIQERRPSFIFITSWNEWHESTSIEPSIISGFKYLIRISQEIGKYSITESMFLKALGVSDCIKLCRINPVLGET